MAILQVTLQETNTSMELWAQLLKTFSIAMLVYQRLSRHLSREPRNGGLMGGYGGGARCYIRKVLELGEPQVTMGFN